VKYFVIQQKFCSHISYLINAIIFIFEVYIFIYSTYYFIWSFHRCDRVEILPPCLRCIWNATLPPSVGCIWHEALWFPISTLLLHFYNVDSRQTDRQLLENTVTNMFYITFYYRKWWQPNRLDIRKSIPKEIVIYETTQTTVSVVAGAKFTRVMKATLRVALLCNIAKHRSNARRN
jgi:hypothetical protein